MKKLLTTLSILLALTLQSQINLSVGIDPVMAVVGDKNFGKAIDVTGQVSYEAGEYNLGFLYEKVDLIDYTGYSLFANRLLTWQGNHFEFGPEVSLIDRPQDNYLSYGGSFAYMREVRASGVFVGYRGNVKYRKYADVSYVYSGYFVLGFKL